MNRLVCPDFVIIAMQKAHQIGEPYAEQVVCKELIRFLKEY